MEVLVDTSVWSLALRRSGQPNAILEQFSELLADGRVKMIGPIRQEILSGISDQSRFKKLKGHLEAFTDLPIESHCYNRAAEMYNICRKSGIAGSHIDFLICAVAEHYQLLILTLDKDFTLYAKNLPVKIFPVDN